MGGLNNLRVPDENMFSPDISSSNMDNTENLDNVDDLFDPANAMKRGMGAKSEVASKR